MKNWIWIALLSVACGQIKETRKLDIQGHRGARGLAPENSIPAFLLAAELGVNTLELDLVVSKDGQLLVSHEPYFSPDFCLDSMGDTIPEDSVINIYELNYEEILQFDCGSKGNVKFPEQEKYRTVKPLLRQVLDTVEAYVITNGLHPIYYNIELKTKKETDTIYHPTPEVFSDLVYDLIFEMDLWDKVNIQSFDFRTLQYFHKKYPDVPLALLIENELDWKVNVDSLGFTPEIYSSYFKSLTPEVVRELQDEGMKVIPWTLNEISDINSLVSMGVDGIITDYPDRALTLIK